MYKNKNSQVRIIGGRWRGRKLPVLNAEGLRPTTDRVKETLFNWLMHDIVGTNCLDCFAGSGSLGLEALSRQASSVVFLEKNYNAVAILKQNIQTLAITNAEIQMLDSLIYLANNQQQRKFDMVFLDPPFTKNLLPSCIELLESQAWLTNTAKIYIESSIHDNFSYPESWQQLKNKQAGQVRYQLFTKQEKLKQ